jgi:HlyD family secretion protein
MAKASLPTNRKETVKLAPSRAVNYVFGSNKVYVVTLVSTIEAGAVKIGDRFEEQVEIMEGVEEGETAATTQLNRLDSGTRVAAQMLGADEASSKSKAD